MPYACEQDNDEIIGGLGTLDDIAVLKDFLDTKGVLADVRIDSPEHAVALTLDTFKKMTESAGEIPEQVDRGYLCLYVPLNGDGCGFYFEYFGDLEQE